MMCDRKEIFMTLRKNEEEFIRFIATKYKHIFSQLIKEGKESNLIELLQDESLNHSNSINVLDYAKENLSNDQRFIIHIHFCLALLDKVYREIIWKEFFIDEEKNRRLEWWSYQYSRSTYYRNRSKAISLFYTLCK